MATVPAPVAATDDALQPEACWQALRARDARFDGSFYTGVTSTGIYCRPVCRVRTPRRENCRFFAHAAQAERAGFRPCLRCRPELAPGAPLAPRWSVHDAGAVLAGQAARLLDEPEAWRDGEASPAALARRLGVSDRHLRRLFEAHFGVSPLQWLQTRRLLAAKQLLADTGLPVAQVALAAGFASVRRFNDAFVQHYGLSPTALRRAGGAGAEAAATVRLGWRPPYDVAAMLAFWRQRAIGGVEHVDAHGLWRTLAIEAGGTHHAGWLHARWDTERCQLVLQAGDGLRPVLPLLVRRVRAAFDLDADPQAIAAVLAADFPGTEGLRVPGAFSGWELAVRAVLGQQVTVAAARTFGQRLATAFGAPLATPHPQLVRLFPTPQALLAAGPEAIGALGIVRQRQGALLALAAATADGRLQLHPGADLPATLAQLTALPGIGDWTAQYIAMRALRWPDAFPAGDVALHKALGVQGRRDAARAAEAASQAWRPWRSYAVLRAWARLG